MCHPSARDDETPAGNGGRGFAAVCVDEDVRRGEATPGEARTPTDNGLQKS